MYGELQSYMVERIDVYNTSNSKTIRLMDSQPLGPEYYYPQLKYVDLSVRKGKLN